LTIVKKIQQTVSRILSFKKLIYLMYQLPETFCGLPASFRTGKARAELKCSALKLLDLAPDEVCHAV